jgi:hypothetical protein
MEQGKALRDEEDAALICCSAPASDATLGLQARLNNSSVRPAAKRCFKSRSVFNPTKSPQPQQSGNSGTRRKRSQCEDHQCGSEPVAAESVFRGIAMRLLRRTVVFHAFVFMPLTAMAETPTPPPPRVQDAAESVRAQPRPDSSAPSSAEEDAVEKRITIFDSTQESLDAALDKKLRICRGC